MKTLFSIVALVCVTGFSQAEPLKIELPVETTFYKPAPGANIANANCLICHSADYAAMQPPMPEKFWRATIEKMGAKYGAPIPTNRVDELVAYFSKNYGSSTNSLAK